MISLHQIDRDPTSHDLLKGPATEIIMDAIYPGRPKGEADQVLENEQMYAMLDHSQESVRLVGAGTLRSLDSGAAARIENIAVPNEERGKGYGAAILTHLEREAESQGAREMELIPVEGTHDFYAGQGYQDGLHGEMYKGL